MNHNHPRANRNDRVSELSHHSFPCQLLGMGCRLRRFRSLSSAALAVAVAPYGSADGAVITSASVGWSGWTGVVSQAINGTLGGPISSSCQQFGDTRFNSFRAVVRQSTTTTAPSRRAALIWQGATNTGYIGVSMRVAGEAIGAGDFFRYGAVVARSTAADFSDASWGPQYGLLAMSSGTAAMTLHGYLPFRFVVGGSGANLDFCYGYFDITVSRSGTGTGAGGTTASSFSMRINGWAYESVANTTIVVTPLAVPGGAGLAALAFGPAGLRGRRRGRN